MKKQMKLKRYISMGVAFIFVVSGSVFGYNWYRDAQRPFYDHGQCNQTYTQCGGELLQYGGDDLAEVQAYFKQTYGIPENQVDILGGYARVQGLDTMRIYAFRVEIMEGYSFTFQKKANTTADYLDGFGYDYVKELDDTQGMIAGLFYEMKHGKDYPEIKEILETEDLLYLADDYKYNTDIRLFYQAVGTRSEYYYYKAPQFSEKLAQDMKDYINHQKKDTLLDINNEIEKELKWEKKLFVLGYTKDSEKFNNETNDHYSVDERYPWTRKVIKDMKLMLGEEDIVVELEILLYQQEIEVKKWGKVR